MTELARATRLKGISLVLIASVIWSTAGPLMRLVHLDIWTIQLWRGLFGAAFLVSTLYWSHGKGLWAELVSLGPIDYFCAVLGTISMFAFVSALAYTSVADVVVVYATLPFVTAILGWLVNHEQVGSRTLVASLMALTGVVIMVSASSGSGRLIGDALSLLMTLSFGLLIVLMRRYSGKSIAIINTMGVLLGIAACAVIAPIQVPEPLDMLVLACLGTVTIGLGLLLFMMGSRLIPSAEAGLIGLIEVVLGPLWVWVAFNENPGAAALIGGAIVLCAVAWQLLGELHQDRSLRG